MGEKRGSGREIGDPGADDHNRDLLTIRHYSLYTPRDFDISPYFQVVKPTIEHGFSYKGLARAETKIERTADPSPAGQPTSDPAFEPEPG